jgi:hypothetical protein
MAILLSEGSATLKMNLVIFSSRALRNKIPKQLAAVSRQSAETLIVDLRQSIHDVAPHKTSMVNAGQRA